jgi:hypothetical protein
MFKPVTTWKCVKGGPHFIAVSNAGSSKVLKFNYNTKCENDFNVLSKLNDGFSIDNTIETPENIMNGNVTAFRVKYGSENQNHFKSIALDQQELRDTAESFQVVDEIGKAGDPSKRILKDQSLFPVLLTRSYTATLDMMGNAMVQPLMYFQLENVPLFYGAYWITNVTHSIQANNMTTTVKATRQNRVTLPIITDVSTVMNIDIGDLGTESESRPNIIKTEPNNTDSSGLDDSNSGGSANFTDERLFQFKKIDD